MQRSNDISSSIDWVTVLIYACLVILGWLNIYAVIYDPSTDVSIFSLSTNAGKQFLWIVTSLLLIVSILLIDYKFYTFFGYVIYFLLLATLVLVLIFGREVAGSKSWFEIGSFRLQPAELAKFATSLALAKFFADNNVDFRKIKHLAIIATIIFSPAVLILLQGDTGSALVYMVFVFVLYREGLTPFVLIVGGVLITLFVLTLLFPETPIVVTISVLAIIFVFLVRKKIKLIIFTVLVAALSVSLVYGVDYFVSNVLKPHQQARIKALINPGGDPLGYGWNVTQSKIAIGSGGLSGKGFLKGTQTKFDFVPEQSTDFIFCTIGEEHGWIGSSIVVILFVVFLYRIIIIAERQKSRFSRVYGYGVVSIFFFHFAINIGMTMGLAPVIGIPLPFFSYGGSSLWSFTILLFILLKLDADRSQILQRNQ